LQATISSEWYFYRGGDRNGKVLSERDDEAYFETSETVDTSEGPIAVMMARDDVRPVVTPCSRPFTATRG
jgi:hypothetical protein